MAANPSRNLPPRIELSPLSFLTRSARAYGDRVAVFSVEDSRTFTYSNFASRVAKLASALRHAGISDGDRIALLSMNRPEALEAHFAVPLARASLVAINYRLTSDEVLYIVKHSGAKLLFFEQELSNLLEPSQEKIKGCELINIPSATHHTRRGQSFLEYEKFLDSGNERKDIAFEIENEDSLIAIDYTSGTTGQPKGVMYSHRGAYLNALSDIMTSGMNCDSVYLWTLPMFHCNGWCYTWAVVGAGAKSITISKIDPSKIWNIIEAAEVTHLCAAPTVLVTLASHAASNNIVLKKKLKVFTGGAPPAPKVIENMEKLGAEVTHLYGMTETYGPNTLCEWRTEWDALTLAERCAIKARQGISHINALETKVVDSEMREIPHDGITMGEIVMNGNTVMLGYFKDKALTEESFRGGWFHSGDLAVVHPDGYIEIRDRSKDIIVTGGEKVSSVEIEKVLYSYPGVLEAAVIAVPDDKWGEVPKAFITPKPGAILTTRELSEYCRGKLAHFKCPRHFEFGELPKTATGKVMKFVLREKEWKGLAKRVA